MYMKMVVMFYRRKYYGTHRNMLISKMHQNADDPPIMLCCTMDKRITLALHWGSNMNVKNAKMQQLCRESAHAQYLKRLLDDAIFTGIFKDYAQPTHRPWNLWSFHRNLYDLLVATYLQPQICHLGQLNRSWSLSRSFSARRCVTSSI